MNDDEVAGVVLVVYIVVILVAFVVGIGIQVGISYLLVKIQEAVPEQFRDISPGMIWLGLIPLFGLGWAFYIYIAIASSYKKVFQANGVANYGDGPMLLGLFHCICQILFFIPCLSIFFQIGSFVLMIIFLVIMFDRRKQLLGGFAMNGVSMAGGTSKPPVINGSQFSDRWK